MGTRNEIYFFYLCKRLPLWRRHDKNSNLWISTSESQRRRRQGNLCPKPKSDTKHLLLCSRWHDDTSFSTFRLARGQAGTFGLIFPACPRESKSSEITVISVTLSSRSRLLPNQKSKTYGAKVRHLRRKSQGLTPRNPLAYEPQSNHKALKNQTSQACRSDTKQGM